MSLIGLCNEMCPRQELKEHSSVLISQFECDKKGNFCPNKAIKKFTRSAAGNSHSAATIRTLSALIKTINYILNNLIAPSIHSSEIYQISLYSYLRDRLRAIRQDIIVQGLHGEDVIKIYEFYAAFFVFSGIKFANFPSKDFDFVQNFEQISQALLSLQEEYLENKTKNWEIFETARVASFFTTDEFNEQIAKLTANKYADELIQLRKAFVENQISLFVKALGKLPKFVAMVIILSDIEMYKKLMYALRSSYRQMAFQKTLFEENCFLKESAEKFREAFNVISKNEEYEYFDVKVIPDDTKLPKFVIPSKFESFKDDSEMLEFLLSLLK